jgi:hypothetical protein
MVSPHLKLAESLEALRALQDRGVVAVRSGDLTRTHRERLVKNGFLQEVMKGWYIPARPDEPTGESTAWYAMHPMCYHCSWKVVVPQLQAVSQVHSEISDVTVLPMTLLKQCKPQTSTFAKAIRSKIP